LHLRYLEPDLSHIFTPSSNTNQRQFSPPTDEDYYSSIPNCIASPNGGYSCLGRVWNNSNQASGSILLSINLRDKQSQEISNQSISIEQWIIPSQAFAPYRAMIAPQESIFQEIEAKIEHILPADSLVRSLKVVDSRGQVSSAGRYRLTTTILNDLEETVEHIRLFASLVDDEQQIVAYRIYEVGENLAGGNRRVIELEIIPQTMPDNIHHELHVEGRALPE
jgi:hypothetical protein